MKLNELFINIVIITFNDLRVLNVILSQKDQGAIMKSKLLSTMCMGLLAVTPMIWGMEMSGENHVHPKSTVISEKTIHATGTVKEIADNHESIRIFHDPISALKWPAMNMPFDVIDHELTHPLSVGDRVEFEFIQKDGKNIIVRMKKQ